MVSPIPDECRNLTDKYLKHLDFQKYKLMVCDWNEETVHKLLMPGMFEDFYYIKYHEGYRDSFDAIPGKLFEEVMTTYLPVTVADLRNAYEYNESTETYRQETVYNSPYPPFLEVTEYKYHSDGTITLYADGVWPDYNSDYAFTNVIVVSHLRKELSEYCQMMLQSRNLDCRRWLIQNNDLRGKKFYCVEDISFYC